MLVCIYSHIYVYDNICIYRYNISWCIYIYIFMFIIIYMYLQIQRERKRFINTWMYMHIHICTYTHTCICIYITTHEHTIGMMEDIKAAPDGSIFMLHACAHNPTGVDPTMDQWKEISAACKVCIYVYVNNYLCRHIVIYLCILFTIISIIITHANYYNQWKKMDV